MGSRLGLTGKLSFSTRTRRSAVALWALMWIGAATVDSGASDWPTYRGPHHDGISTETIRTNWKAVPPVVVWRRAIEPGFSTFSVQAGRLYTLVNRGNQEPQEYAVALEASTGRELWATALDVAEYSGGTGLSVDGPRSTPAIDGDFVYCFTAYLRLVCLRASDGSVVWKRDFVKEYGSNVIGWQNAASPILFGDLVLVNCNAGSGGRLTAVRKSDGQQVWRRHLDDKMTHATPVLATIGGTSQIIFYTQAGLVSLLPTTGDVLWRQAVSYNGTSSAASPVVAGDAVYVSRAYPTKAGALVVDVQGSGTQFTATTRWSKPNQLLNHWATPVYVGGHFYGIYGQGGQHLDCVDAETGAQRWQMSGYGSGGVLSVSGVILGSTDSGDLVLVAPDPSAYREIARFHAVDTDCWNVPAISQGRIYVRGMTQAACLDVAVAVPKMPLKLTARNLSATSGFQFRVTNADGSDVASGRLSGVEVMASDDPARAMAAWTKLSLSPVVDGGGYLYTDTQATSLPRRFYILRDP